MRRKVERINSIPRRWGSFIWGGLESPVARAETKKILVNYFLDIDFSLEMIRSDGGLVFATTCHESGCVFHRPDFQELPLAFGILFPEWDDYPELGFPGLDGLAKK